MDLIDEWSQLLLIFLLSVFKYGLGLFTAVNSSLVFWQSILTNLIGGALGVFMFTYFGSVIKAWYIRWRYKNKPPRKFTKWNRFQIFLKDKFGMFGIAFFSPILLTIPVGVFLAFQITDNKKKIFFFIYGGCVLWSWIFFIVDFFFDFNLLFWMTK